MAIDQMIRSIRYCVLVGLCITITGFFLVDMDFVNNIIKGTPNLDIKQIHSAVNEFVHMISYFLDKYLNTSLQKISILHWIGLSFLLWVIVHAIYYKAMKVSKFVNLKNCELTKICFTELCVCDVFCVIHE